MGALIIGIGFGGILYQSYNKEPITKLVLVIIAFRFGGTVCSMASSAPHRLKRKILIPQVILQSEPEL